MLTDYEIARQAGIRPISDIAEKLGVESGDLMPYGGEIAKVNLALATGTLLGHGRIQLKPIDIKGK